MGDIRFFLVDLDKETLEKYKKYLKEDLLEIENFYKTKLYKRNLRAFNRKRIQFLSAILRTPKMWRDFKHISYDILLLLIVGSFSNSWHFDIVYKDNGIEISLVIEITLGDKKVITKLEDLHYITIERMFRIYLQEQLDMIILDYSSKKERAIIRNIRKGLVEHFNKEYERVKLLYEAMK